MIKLLEPVGSMLDGPKCVRVCECVERTYDFILLFYDVWYKQFRVSGETLHIHINTSNFQRAPNVRMCTDQTSP